MQSYKKQIISLLVGIICAFASCAYAQNITVSKPVIDRSNTSIVAIDKVVLSKDSTTIKFNAYYLPNYWIKISPQSFLQVGDKIYNVKNGIGIGLGEKFYMPETGEAEFSVSFEPLPLDTKKFDFKEGNSNNGEFVIEGIDLTKSFNDMPRLPLLSESTTVVDLEALLKDAGYENYSFDLSPLVYKDHTLQLIVKEYESGKMISSKVIREIDNRMHISIFPEESQARIMADGDAVNPDEDIYKQCERFNIRFQPIQGDSVRMCCVEWENIGAMFMPFNLRKISNEGSDFCRYDIRPFENYEYREFEFCPLLLLGSWWFDENFKVYRFCGEAEIAKDMSSSILNELPHYYVIGIRAIPK